MLLQDGGVEPRYYLPYPEGKTHACIQGYLGKFTHDGLYGIDFEMPEGSPVCAARSGIVRGVKEDSDRGGPDRKFLNDGNYIWIEHGDGTTAMYAHLKKDGALVEEGTWVFAGETIGLSGKTGYASGPHLHFQVERDRKTFPVRFHEFEGEPADGKKYTSKNSVSPLVRRKREWLDADLAARLAWKYGLASLARPHLESLAQAPDDAGLFRAARDRLKDLPAEGERIFRLADAEREAGNADDALELAALGLESYRGFPVEEKFRELKGRLEENGKRTTVAARHLQIFLEGLRLELRGKPEAAKPYYRIVAESDIATRVVPWAKERLAGTPP